MCFSGTGISQVRMKTNGYENQRQTAIKNDLLVPKGLDTKIIRKLLIKFERTGSVIGDLVGNVDLSQTITSPKNNATFSGILHQNPRKSMRTIASDTCLKHFIKHKVF
ncbi:hypothetical protein NPIL_589631 [Nephila pilipes]|uniref:Uncharacterized protein n=1 Tax=Nephila pilipes TaxID=299642 RepID=A0A8X6Q4E9_NEPPI|nr:hypothetical protein NPIL_589631 [Nephila pilipes]